MTETQKWSELNYDTPSGIFKSDKGLTYWIIDSSGEDRYAIQLTASGDTPLFGYHYLSAEVIATGEWVGDARLRVRKEREDSTLGVCGLLMHRGRRLYLKANNECGQGAYLFIKGYDEPGNTDTRSYYPDWQLIMIGANEGAAAFTAPTRLTKMRNYGEQLDLRYVEWC